jgi:hypothetical protein
MPFVLIHRFRILLLFSQSILQVRPPGVGIPLGEKFFVLLTCVNEKWGSPSFLYMAQAFFYGRMAEGLWP